MTPVDYLLAQIVNGLSAGCIYAVAAIGYSVGYDSPSQFSREYSRLFGVPPGRDKLRLGLRPVREAS